MIRLVVARDVKQDGIAALADAEPDRSPDGVVFISTEEPHVNVQQKLRGLVVHDDEILVTPEAREGENWWMVEYEVTRGERFSTAATNAAEAGQL